MAETNGNHSSIKKALIIGANFPATPIIRSLLNASIDVHIIHPRTPIDPFQSATYHETDTTSSSALKPLFTDLHPDVLISTISGGSYNTQKLLIDAALAAGIPRFIPHEFGQDSTNEHVQERIPPSKERARVLEYLHNLSVGEEQSRFSYVAIATGVDLDRGLLSGQLGFDIKWQSATIHGSGRERFAGSSSAWIGKVVLAVLRQWDAVRNRYLYAAGLTASGDEVVTAFERVTGKAFVASRADVDECVREARQRIERGFPDAGMFLLARSVMYDEKVGAVRPFEEDDAKTMLGLEGEKLQDVVEWVVHEHRHHDKGGCGCD